MFLSMSVKKSSAKGIRNTEKIYNFVIVGYCLYKSIDSGFLVSFLADNDFKKVESARENKAYCNLIGMKNIKVP